MWCNKYYIIIHLCDIVSKKINDLKSETKLIVKLIQIINLIIMKLRFWPNVYVLFVCLCLGLVIQLQIP